MAKPLSRRRLSRVYRRYAGAMDWTTHAKSVQLHVELWLTHGVGAMGPALDYDAHQKAQRFCLRQPLMALAVLGIALTAILGACVLR